MGPITQEAALVAMRSAADGLRLEPDELTLSAYRGFRRRGCGAEELPSEIAISLLFGGWPRAVEQLSHRDDTPLVSS
jgi:hypothetical protein